MPNPISSWSCGALALTMLVITSALTGPQEVRARGTPPEPSNGMPPTQRAQPTGRDIIGAPGFWDKPEQDQITALSAVSPTFKSSNLEVQLATLQRLHQIVAGRGVSSAGILADPEFLGLPEPEELTVLRSVDPQFAALPEDQQKLVLTISHTADGYLRRKSPAEILADPQFYKLSEQAQRMVMQRADPKFKALSVPAQKVVLSRYRQKLQAQSNVGPPKSILLAEILVGALVLGSLLLILFRRHRSAKQPKDASERAVASRSTRLLHKIRSLSRPQTVILWLTASAVLMEVMYPTTVLLVRSGDWSRVPSQKVAKLAKDDCCPLANRIGNRKLIVTLEQWDDLDLKEAPDFRRMATEAAISVLIGGSLAYALKLRNNRECDR